MTLECSDYIGLTCVFIILYLLFKKKDHFTTTPAPIEIVDGYKSNLDPIYKKIYDKYNVSADDIINIVNKYGIDISALRNMAQLSQKVYSGEDNTLQFNIPTEKFNINNLSLVDNNIKKSELKCNNLICDNIKFSGDVNILNIYPQYMIVPWGGPTIPDNWKVCDGKIWYKNQNQYIEIVMNDIGDFFKKEDVNFVNKLTDLNNITITPDLQDRFIIGASNSNKLGDPTPVYRGDATYNYQFAGSNAKPVVGGEETVLLNKTHIPPHYHTFNMPTAGISSNYGTNDANLQGMITTGIIRLDHMLPDILVDKTPQEPLTTSGIVTQKFLTSRTSLADFTHTNTPHNNMPPYNSLVYIIKL